jgi:O-antigen/teichoic acid export membrane protein
MAMSMLFVSVLGLLNELGLGAAIIQNRELDTDALRQIFGLVIVSDFLLFAVLFSGAPFIAFFFGESQLTLIIRVLSVQFLLMSFNIIPQSLLERDLDFKQRSMVDICSNVLGGFLTLGLALMGRGVWALVYGSLFMSLSRTVGLNIARPFFHLPSFSLKGMRNAMAFGGFVTAERLLWYFYSQADTFIIGKLLGKEILGFYSIGRHIVSTPMDKMSPIITQLSFPAFALIQDDSERVTYYFTKAVGLISLLAFPIFMGISSVGPEIISILLGEKWALSIYPIILISLISPIGMISGLVQSMLKGLGRADASFRNILTASVLMPLAFLIGSKWGIVGVCAAWLVAYPIYFVIMSKRSCRIIGIGFIDLLKAMGRPFLASAGMYLAVVVIRQLIAGVLSTLTGLVLLIISGAVVLAILVLSINRERLFEALALWKR